METKITPCFRRTLIKYLGDRGFRYKRQNNINIQNNIHSAIVLKSIFKSVH